MPIDESIRGIFRKHGVQGGIKVATPLSGDEEVFIVSPEGSASMDEIQLVAELTHLLRKKVYVTTDGPQWKKPREGDWHEEAIVPMEGVSTAGLKGVSDGDFEQQVLQSDRPVLVEFWAPWCRPCLWFAQIVGQIASDYRATLTVARLDIDASQRTAVMCGVQSIPTLILFKNGKAIKRLMGVMTRERISSEVQSSIGQEGNAQSGEAPSGAG